MKITLHLLALCLLLSITTKVSGKPRPRHLLIETKEQTKAKNNGGYHNSQSMDNKNIIGGSQVSQSQSNGGGSHNSQSMKNNNFGDGAKVSQTQSMDNKNIIGGSQVSQ